MKCEEQTTDQSVLKNWCYVYNTPLWRLLNMWHGCVWECVFAWVCTCVSNNHNSAVKLPSQQLWRPPRAAWTCGQVKGQQGSRCCPYSRSGSIESPRKRYLTCQATHSTGFTCMYREIKSCLALHFLYFWNIFVFQPLIFNHLVLFLKELSVMSRSLTSRC